MRVFVGHNYFGAGNFGDDLTLAGFLAAAQRRSRVEITICTPHDRVSQQRRFPQVRWLPDDAASREKALREADLWLALGDTPFQLDSGPWLLDHNDAERRRCTALGKPMYLLGVGCESAEAAADPRARALLAAAERVWTRDELSAEMLRPHVAAARLSSGADLAHLAFARDAAAPPREHGVVGLLPAFERREQFDLREIDLFVTRRAPETTRWLVQEVRALPYLERWILGELSAAARASLAITDVNYATMSMPDYLRAFGAPEVTVTTRYHAALIAAWHGSKVLVVSRSAKLRGIANALGLPAIERLDSHRALEAALDTAVAPPLERMREVRRCARAMCETFFEHAGARRRTSVHAAVARAAACEPLPSAVLRAAFEVTIPPALRAGETAVVPCAVSNRGGATYLSAPPNPVELCYRWYDASGAAVGAGTWLHTPLVRPLPPGDTLQTALRVGAPERPGTYTLAVTLLQEGVAWFDDVDPASGVRGAVDVLDSASGADQTEAFYALDAADRRCLTLRSIEARAPLFMRWDRPVETWSEWSLRAALAADWLGAARSVADLGCGAMTLERYLAPWQEYVPVDLVARDERTVVADLDKDELTGISAEACALLGVIEYLFEPAAALAKIAARFVRAVVSYNVASNGHVESRLEHGWVNHFTHDELRRLFRAAGLAVVREQVVEGTQYLFELVPQPAPERNG